MRQEDQQQPGDDHVTSDGPTPVDGHQRQDRTHTKGSARIQAGTLSFALSTADSPTYDPDLDRVIAPQGGIYSVCFEPTNECPGKCPYCLIEEHRIAYTATQVRAVLDRLLDTGVKRIGFGGGEPLLLPDIYSLGHHTRSRGAGALLRTSAMFDIDINLAKAAFDWIDVSIDSINPKVFRKCRPGVPLDILMRNISRLAAADARIRCSILITQLNANLALETISWLKEAGVRHVRLSSLVHRGKASRSGPRLSIDTVRMEKTLNEALMLASPDFSIKVLESVNSQTLCIVKPDGDCYYATPLGLKHTGSVFEDDWQSRLPVKTRENQQQIYLAQRA